jgi:hypothetical protein
MGARIRTIVRRLTVRAISQPYPGFDMMKLIFAAAIAASALLALPASATVLNFTNTGCTSGGGTNCLIPQSYGDSQEIDVSYRTLNASTGQPAGTGLFYFAGGYGNLSGIVYGGSDSTHYKAELTLTAKPGKLVSLQSFDFGTYANRAAKVPITISDLDGNVLTSGLYSTGYPGHGTLSPNTALLSGIVIRWGPDSYNVGLDNITYTTGNAVPEPASWAMMLAGFGALGWRARKGPAATFA